MTKKASISEIIIVEGRDDTANLKRFYQVDTYETRGSAISEQDLERIRRLNDSRGVIVFTDPDYNGERIRKMIMQAVPSAKHAFLNREEAKPKSKSKGRSLGVEHASFEDLEKALSHVLGEGALVKKTDISRSDLLRLGLLMGADSRKRREFLGEQLRIGYCNGKQLLKRLEMFNVKRSDLEDAMTHYKVS
ncbi:ribonuclease M5 [Streptococcus sp. zg-JUN1979]|uniref:ribonuclease M5 n=1 Tax=Streptococcus sp. zg-JUN1979 TaxID=3391450 RepID=UPI0039A695E7